MGKIIKISLFWCRKIEDQVFGPLLKPLDCNRESFQVSVTQIYNTK